MRGPSAREVRGPAQVARVRRLLAEYVRSLDIDLDFQGIDRELAEFPGPYVAPRGALFLAEAAGRAAGCAGVRPLAASVAELKRLYVRPRYRGRGVGRALTLLALRWAEEAGYRRLRLDTLGSMRAAIGLYRSLGFREIAPYRYNPDPRARFFELRLGPGRSRRARARPEPR